MFSKACEYAIRSCIYIADQSHGAAPGTRVGLKDIAKEIESPEAFTAKILQTLARNGLVDSLKGPTGGFSMTARQLKENTLLKIVIAIDGPKLFTSCGIGMKHCSDAHPCPAHHEFKKIRSDLELMLAKTNMLAMLDPLHEGRAFLRT